MHSLSGGGLLLAYRGIASTIISEMREGWANDLEWLSLGEMFSRVLFC